MRKDKPKFKKERPPDQHAVGVDWRLFIAVPMPAEVQGHVARIVAALSEFDLPVRWIASESAHLTLHFLGEIPSEQAELVRMGLTPPIARHTPFTVRTDGLGVFPDARRPRVLWLGLTGETDRLAGLHRDIGQQLLKFEFDVDTRRFHPHITLGRVRDDPPASIGADVQRALDDPRIAELVLDRSLEIAVDDVLLMRSFLERGGARHVPVSRYRLRVS